MIKKILRLGVALVLSFSLSGCTKDIDGKYKGLSIGFNYTGPHYSEVMCAVRSDKTEFNINDVTLEFYFGWFGSDLSHINTLNEENEFASCIAFYITTNEVGRWIDPQKDYHNVANQFFMFEIPINDFLAGAYNASQTKSKGKIFNHSGEKLTLPKEAFSQQQGILDFYAQEISYSDEDNLFHFSGNDSNRVSIWYKYINSYTVLLSK